MATLEEKKNDPIFMKEYLRHALEFEKHIFLWTNALENVKNKARSFRIEHENLLAEKNDAEISWGSVDEETKKEKDRTKRELDDYKNKCKSKKKRKIIFWSFIFPFSLILFIYSILTKNAILAAVAGSPYILYFAFKLYATLFMGVMRALLGMRMPETQEEKKREMEQYEQMLNSDCFEQGAIRKKNSLQQKIDDLNCAIQDKDQKISVARMNQESIKKVLVEAKTTLNDIYSVNVLPVKYRSFNAVATLYEYLENGVCTVVQGHGGIYDTYEYHLEIGRIIAKLDVIIQKLEQIAANQEVLYEAITETNQLLGKIDQDIMKGNQAFSDYATASLSYQRQQLAATQWHNWYAHY